MFGNLDDFFIDALKEGISPASCDIFIGKYFIYVLTPQNRLLPIVIYDSKLLASSFEKRLLPQIHFCFCDELKLMLEQKRRGILVKFPTKNSFFYQVGTNKQFYDVKLPFCPKCSAFYKKSFMKLLDEIPLLWNVDRRYWISEKNALEGQFDGKKFSKMDMLFAKNYFIAKYKKEI